MTQTNSDLPDASTIPEAGSSPLADLLTLLAGSTSDPSSGVDESSVSGAAAPSGVSPLAPSPLAAENSLESPPTDLPTDISPLQSSGISGTESVEAATLKQFNDLSVPAKSSEQLQSLKQQSLSEPVKTGENLEDLESAEENLLQTFGALAGGGDEFDQLQELLVKPEILELRDRMTELEQKLEALSKRDYDPKKFIQLMVPVMAELLNRHFGEFTQQILIQFKQEIFLEFKQQIVAEFKQDMLDAIAPIANKVNTSSPDTNLSIRVIGLQKDA